MEYITQNSQETEELGKKIGSFLREGDCLALSGPLASGKTTFTKGVALALGVADTVTSPTFTIISEYAGNIPLYHFDVYRLENADDFINLGADDMLYGNGVCVIEWSERIRDELPEDTIFITFETPGAGQYAGGSPDGETRKITVDNWKYHDE